MLAEVGGKRNFKKTAKHCYSDAHLIDLMVQDRLTYYQEQVKRGRYTESGAVTIAVEPSDGAGHCECSDCAAMGHVSNRVFHGANAVAKAFKKQRKGLYANLNAYFQHVEVPDFTLEDNVYVSLAPYSLQWASSPEDLIQRWKKKANHLLIYDYWAIPTSRLDVPYNYLQIPKQRIPFWSQSGLEGFIAETSYSSMATGLALYLAGKLMWNPEANVTAILSEFYQKSFETAAPLVQQVLEGLANYDHLSYELPIACEKLAKASQLTTNPAVQTRIDDIKAYVYYLHLLNQYKQASKGSKARQNAAEEVLMYAWKIRDRMVIHSYWIHYSLAMVSEKNDPVFKKKWGFPLADETATTVANIPQASGMDIERFFNKAKNFYPKTTESCWGLFK